jgi:2-oxoglutarate dehydrogenase E1 component
MDFWHQFPGPNAAYVLELYERYRHDPQSLDPGTRRFFDQWSPPPDGATPAAGGNPAVKADTDLLKAAVAASGYAQVIRERGHLIAAVNPLRPAARPSELMPPERETDALRTLPAALVGGPVALRSANAWDAVQSLHDIYCSASGYEYSHLRQSAGRTWFQETVESGRCRPPSAPLDEPKLLERLTEVEVFERYLQQAFPGRTRFSIEGVDMLVPMLDETARLAAESGVRRIFIGMGHRGRFNVLAHILQKPYAEIVAELRGAGIQAAALEDAGWTGDVKYHAGGCRPPDLDDEGRLSICMPPNPSHLESTYPVVEGMARAAGSQTGQTGAPKFDPDIALAVVLHGDASFPGQGVVAETLNMAGLPAYQTGGTIHIIANNQLGYTATTGEAYSGRNASDLALGFDMPVVHVNADVPEACLEAVRMAFEYRERFRRDFVIDLVGYRRHGHNEGDEPAFTQPVMYRQIRAHPTARAQLAERLRASKQIESTWPEALEEHYMEFARTASQDGAAASGTEPLQSPAGAPPPSAETTAVPVSRLAALNGALLSWPETFTLSRKLERYFVQRRQAFDEPDRPTIDWSLAETLALASILEDGIAVRLTGEDACRGTFSQRHAVLYDADTGAAYVPLEALPQARAAFEVANSPVTEFATLAFEFGYSSQEPQRLLLWEAQYGDFINIAQGVVDEYIVSACAKWNQPASLVLLLPHGNEGQGPDHSSGRLERFLQLAAGGNVQIAIPTTAAQYFHLLRQQALRLRTSPRPLIVFTPKGLLRHPRVASTPQALASPGWHSVIDDAGRRGSARTVRRLLLCSGRVYFDLATHPLAEQMADQVAIARVEQLHPLPDGDLTRLLQSYPGVTELVWVQEEPRNMGAWEYLRPTLAELANGRWQLLCVSRPAMSSPAEGSAAQYAVNQRALVEQALGVPGRGPDAGSSAERT